MGENSFSKALQQRHCNWRDLVADLIQIKCTAASRDSQAKRIISIAYVFTFARGQNFYNQSALTQRLAWAVLWFILCIKGWYCVCPCRGICGTYQRAGHKILLRTGERCHQVLKSSKGTSHTVCSDWQEIDDAPFSEIFFSQKSQSV